MSYERIERDGLLYAEVIWAGTTVQKSRFFSGEQSSLQFGLLAHEAGFVEPAHYHHPIKREISDLQQMLVVQRGVLAIDFFTPEGAKFHEVVLRVGDAINLVHGVHAVRVIEDMQCVSVKQGPFFGDKLDKINVSTK
ncbi:hypothetical protein [Bradyrhizobium sp. HKCCYLS20291]|uniref:hypothetical protein n=1 Tax=Bradyrhizobium sp. HKCCYLS20291 TaxID=3420766 RepID=UPI003EB8DD92